MRPSLQQAGALRRPRSFHAGAKFVELHAAFLPSCDGCSQRQPRSSRANHRHDRRARACTSVRLEVLRFQILAWPAFLLCPPVPLSPPFFDFLPSLSSFRSAVNRRPTGRRAWTPVNTSCSSGSAFAERKARFTFSARGLSAGIKNRLPPKETAHRAGLVCKFRV